MGLIIAAIALLAGVGVLVFSNTVGHDNPLGFRKLTITGDQPQMESQKRWSDPYRQFVLAYHLSTGSMVHTTFEVPSGGDRLFLHARVRLLEGGTACSSATRLDYEITSDGATIISGALGPGEDKDLGYRPVGHPARIGWLAQLHGAPGCQLTVQLRNPALHTLPSWIGRNEADYLPS
jgi:hypothetical protein